MIAKLPLLLLMTAALALPACEEKPKTLPEKIENSVKDGVDARPNEKVRDAGENLQEAGRDMKDAIKDKTN